MAIAKATKYPIGRKGRGRNKLLYINAGGVSDIVQGSARDDHTKEDENTKRNINKVTNAVHLAR